MFNWIQNLILRIGLRRKSRCCRNIVQVMKFNVLSLGSPAWMVMQLPFQCRSWGIGYIGKHIKTTNHGGEAGSNAFLVSLHCFQPVYITPICHILLNFNRFGVVLKSCTVLVLNVSGFWGHLHIHNSIAYLGCFQRCLFVCLCVCVCVCLFFCEHDNFRMRIHRVMKLGGRFIV